MTCVKKTTDIKLEAVKVLWGVEQCRSLQVQGAAAMGGKYFDLNLIDENYNEIQGYVFLDDGVEVDPAPAGKTLIASPLINEAGTEAENAVIIKAALEASPSANLMKIEIEAETPDTMDIENQIFGAVSAETAGDSTFVYALGNAGLGGDLGKTAQGGVALNLETQTTELKADQTAELILGEINQGNLTTIEMSLLELTKERFKTLIGSVVGDIVDMGADGEYVGIGTSKLFKELSAFGGRMVLHPIRISDISDRSEDWSFHITTPIPSSINFSGTEQQALEISFKPYVDESKPAAASVGGYGDWLALINL